MHRHTIDTDGDELFNNFTIKHSPINSNSSSSNKNETISSINSNLRNMSPSYHHDDDKLIHSTVTHSVPVVAAPPAEPKSKCWTEKRVVKNIFAHKDAESEKRRKAVQLTVRRKIVDFVGFQAGFPVKISLNFRR